MSRALTVLFAAALIVALAAMTPLRAAAGWLGFERFGLAAREVTGTVWSGRLHDASFRGAPLGEVAVALDPLGLLVGTVRLKAVAEGGVLTGRATLIRSGSGFGLAKATGIAPLSLSLGGVPVRGALSAEGLDVRFQAGRCVSARGRLATDLLQRNTALTGAAGPVVSGEAACSGGALTAPLRGRAGGTDVALLLRVEADGRYRIETRVAAADPALAARLALAGFVGDGAARVRTDQGRLWR